jgi:hypothetical protein
MEKYLEQIRLFTFGILIDLIFKISKKFRLVRFEKVQNNGVIDFKFIIRASNTDDFTEPDSDVVKHVLEYLENPTTNN